MPRGLRKDERSRDVQLMVTGNACPLKKVLVEEKREETGLPEQKSKVLPCKKDGNRDGQDVVSAFTFSSRLFTAILNNVGSSSDL